MKRSELKRKTPLKSYRHLKRTPMQRKKLHEELEGHDWKRPAKKSHRKSSEYTKELRDFIKERDNHECRVCGDVGTQVHHVVPRGRFYRQWYTVESVHDPRNLMLVCHRCHQRIHDEAGFLERVIEMQERRFGSLRKNFG